MIIKFKNKLNQIKRSYNFYRKNLKLSVGSGYELFLVAKKYENANLFPEYEDIIHLKETIKWLKNAQDACHGNGVSATYYLGRGWDVAYPETTGYIIPTFLTFSELYDDTDLLNRAIKLGDWEIEIQTNSGGILSNPLHQKTRVFNTGQVILGWCALYEKTKNQKYLHAAMKAGEYLIEMQEQDGQWIRNTYCGSRTYHARVDWALLRLGLLSQNNKFIIAAEKNLRWVIKQQNKNDFFENCGFNDDVPNMHVLSYTIRGLLECYAQNIEIINQLNFLQNIIKTADRLCIIVEEKAIENIKGLIPTSLQNNWITNDNDACLTGNAQFAIFLYRLYQITGNLHYIKIAEIIIKALKRTQLINEKYPNISGAISGSYPIYRGYMPNCFPNWAAKFFADALIIKNNQNITLKS
jgi:hypothetical protein